MRVMELRSNIWQPLVRNPPSRQGTRRCPFQQGIGIVDREKVRSVDVPQFIPTDRNGHWRLFARSNAIG